MSKIIFAFYVVATSLGLIFLKLGTKTGLPISYINNRPHVNINFFNVAGIGLYGISFMLYMYLISKNDLGYIIPITAAFVYVLVFLASYFIFHEIFTLTKVIGIVLILGGLFFLNFKK